MRQLGGYGAVVLVLAFGCAKEHQNATPDAAAPDAAVPQRPTCPECVMVPFKASDAFDVASDGTIIYVTFSSLASAQQQLGIVSAAGGAPTTIATAAKLVLASSGDAVFYAANTGTSYELHQRVGADDTVLGNVTSDVTVGLAANATDLYVVGSETVDTSTLWRFSRTALSGTPPAVVATGPKFGGSLVLGTTVAAWGTTGGASLAAIPGPSVTSSQGGINRFAFSNDRGFQLLVSMLTSHTTSWSISEFVPETTTIYTDYFLVNGTVSAFQADANHLYWRETQGSEMSLSTTTSLVVGSPDGNGRAAYQWGSDLIRQDSAHLYGLENSSPGHWVVDVLAKP